MRLRRSLLVIAAAVLTACGNDENSFGLDDLAGSYEASDFEFVSLADPNTTFDAIQQGFVITLDVAADGDYTLSATLPPNPPDVSTGTIAIDGDEISLDEAGDVITGTFSHTGNFLTLHLTSGVEFDFDDDGTDDPARVDAIFVRD